VLVRIFLDRKVVSCHSDQALREMTVTKTTQSVATRSIPYTDRPVVGGDVLIVRGDMSVKGIRADKREWRDGVVDGVEV
jgi:hypothetical protein